ncbi:MAG TPA: sugar transferase, partial [Planctomycetaceae bacterium]
ICKIRTMVQDAEARTGAVWAQADDPRVTPLGRFLRQTHIDEFPQLFQVLAGHMSLVGPRPERPEFVRRLQWEIPRYVDRLVVKPGVTGLAQLVLPADSDLEDVRRKVQHDLYYVRHVGPRLDAVLIVHTAWLLVKTLAAAAIAPFRLPQREAVCCWVAELERKDRGPGWDCGAP